MALVFVSYRRSDAGWVRALTNRLVREFGAASIFHDREDLEPGDDFLDRIKSEAGGCRVLVAVIGPTWLEGRRIDDPADVLRGEIATALSSGAEVFPVLVGGAHMPRRRDLPDEIAALSRHQALELTDSHWEFDEDRLVEKLRRTLAAYLPTRQLHDHLYRLQEQFRGLLGRDADAALRNARETLAVLDRAIPLHPEDGYLVLTLGFTRKNEGLALNALGRPDDGKQALERADRIFLEVIESRPRDVDAWVGRASVSYARSDYEKALELIDHALELDPDHPVAKGDRQIILDALGRKR